MIKLSDSELQTRLAQVKLFAIDVDGVLTDGGLYYTESGEELKKFNVKDGLGLRRVLEAGIEVAFVSANQSRSTLHRAKKLGIVHALIGVSDKLAVLQNLCKELNVSLTQVAYVGDDLVDLPILESVGVPIAVADAVSAVQTIAVYITQKTGGNGAVREVCDLLLESISPYQNRPDCDPAR